MARRYKKKQPEDDIPSYPPLSIRKTRTCLRCQEPFASEGVENRICPRCTRINNKTGKDSIARLSHSNSKNLKED